MTLLVKLAVYAAWLLGSVVAYVLLRRKYANPKAICVIVLGDLGRSPRMMYHAQSLLDHGYIVYLVGFAGTPILASLASHSNLVVVHVAQPPKWISQLPRTLWILVAPFKLVFGALALLWALVIQLPTFPRAIMVQTPPALPTLPIVQLARGIHASELIVDWHNTAFSILAMRLGLESPLVRLAKRLEAAAGRKAHAHLFVTDAMKATLSYDWSLIGTKAVFHDRPQTSPTRLSASEAHSLFSRLSALRDPALAVLAPSYGDSYGSSTLFTSSVTSTTADWRKDRPALLVSSTSWTADEDFSILLEAMETYENAVQAEGLPKLVVLITGKGEGKETFVKQVKEKERHWKYVRCRTVWLEAEDYPKLLAAADLGVSLHTSSSGLDLPMKIVDMFGAGLPVLSLAFPCIGELVQDGSDGRLFEDAGGFASQLKDVLQGFPNSQALEKLREGVLSSGGRTWSTEWDEVVLPIIQGCCTDTSDKKSS